VPAAVVFVDFKISRLTQWGTSTHAVARIYLGDITTEDETDAFNVTRSVTRYRRQELLAEVFLDYPGSKTQAEIEADLRQRLTRVRRGVLPIVEQRDA